MSEDKRGFFAHAFFAMMLFCGLVWIWTVAFIIAWPWDKTSDWKPEFRVVAVCGGGEICGIPYGQLAESKSKGLYTSINVPGEAGDVMEEKGWLQWKKVGDLIEAKASSWHFQTTIRYKVEDEKPILVEFQDVGAKALYFGMAAALVSLIGLYFRKLRR